MDNLSKKLRRLEMRGFVGPKYQGLLGKLRLLKQGLIGHREIITCADRTKWEFNETVINPKIQFRLVERYEDSLKYAEEMEKAYFKDFKVEWQQFFSWGNS